MALNHAAKNLRKFPSSLIKSICLKMRHRVFIKKKKSLTFCSMRQKSAHLELKRPEILSGAYLYTHIGIEMDLTAPFSFSSCKPPHPLFCTKSQNYLHLNFSFSSHKSERQKDAPAPARTSPFTKLRGSCFLASLPAEESSRAKKPCQAKRTFDEFSLPAWHLLRRFVSCYKYEASVSRTTQQIPGSQLFFHRWLCVSGTNGRNVSSLHCCGVGRDRMCAAQRFW